MKPYLRRSVRGVVALAGVALAIALIVGLAAELTRERIAASRLQASLDYVRAVLPPGYDDDLLADTIEIRAPAFFEHPVRVYRARANGQPIGVALVIATPEGYGGSIRLCVGLRDDGTVTGVRVVEHHETRGLGAAIDHRESPWSTQFTGRSLGDPVAAGWYIRRDGGVFDQISGATISARAVVKAVHRSLRFYAEYREQIYSG